MPSIILNHGRILVKKTFLKSVLTELTFQWRGRRNKRVHICHMEMSVFEEKLKYDRRMGSATVGLTLFLQKHRKTIYWYNDI